MNPSVRVLDEAQGIMYMQEQEQEHGPNWAYRLMKWSRSNGLYLSLWLAVGALCGWIWFHTLDGAVVGVFAFGSPLIFANQIASGPAEWLEEPQGPLGVWDEEDYLTHIDVRRSQLWWRGRTISTVLWMRRQGETGMWTANVITYN